MQEKLFVVIPAYNESENIEKTISEWYPIVEKHHGEGQSRLVIIDDGSKDDTYKKISKSAEEKSLITPLTKENGGHGQTVLHAYNYAIDNDADWIFQTDSDGQTDPAEFEKFWQLRNDYDAIIGSRPDRQDGLSRKFVEKTLLAILRVTFGVKMPDSNAPFRLMKRELVEKYISKLPKDFNLPNVMLTTYFTYFNERIKFIDISFKPRQGGVNSINIKRITKIGLKAVKDFHQLKKTINK